MGATWVVALGGKSNCVAGSQDRGDPRANTEKRLMKKRAMEEWLMIVQLLLSSLEEEGGRRRGEGWGRRGRHKGIRSSTENGK